MPANKMPEMPEAPKDQALSFGHTSVELLAFAETYGLACYLAGIAEARECVPEAIGDRDADGKYEWGRTDGFNRCRNLTLTNLTALEQEAKK